MYSQEHNCLYALPKEIKSDFIHYTSMEENMSSPFNPYSYPQKYLFDPQVLKSHKPKALLEKKKTKTSFFDSYLPFCKHLIQEEEFPLPVGTSLLYFYQEQNHTITDLKAKALPQGYAIDPQGVYNTSQITSVKLDTWLFPFLNIYGIIGYLEGSTSIKKVIVIPPQDAFESTYNVGKFSIDYEGIIYGGGATLAIGYKNFFSALDLNFTRARLDIAQSSTHCLNISPKIGFRKKFIQKGELIVWVGTMYQQMTEHQIGTGSMQGIQTKYEVIQEAKDAWNYLFGFQWNLNSEWNLLIEGGIGNRKQVTASMVYRF